MLANSFSYLPVEVPVGEGSAWRLIPDLTLARYMRKATSKTDLNRRLAQTLGEVVGAGRIKLVEARVHGPTDSIDAALDNWDGLPILVQSGEKQLLGILTAFDLL